MKRALYIARDAAEHFRRVVGGSAAEHGGALVGDPATGDIFAFVPTPETTERSEVVIHFRGSALDALSAKVEATRAWIIGSAWLGFGHSHDDVHDLSAGDRAQIDGLVRDPRVPPCGLVTLLAVKRRTREPRLRVWVASAPGDLEELQLREVDDPAAARALDGSKLGAPRVRSAVLAEDMSALRLEAELHELEAEGFRVSAECVDRGVELRLVHDALAGELLLLFPVEGWERPPKARLVRPGKEPELFGLALGTFLAGWSSAYSLGDLVGFLREKKLWPRAPRKRRVTTEVSS